MAKQFYNVAEASKRLRVTEEQLKGMVREGKLREYRDAGKVNYRIDEVDRLAAKEGSSVVDLALGDEGPRDMGLSSSDVITLESDEKPRKATKEDTKISNVGINVFDDEELQIDADPLAETRITAAVSDQVPLGGVGSGSGLMDLTRESDDTSLGAELLDVISPTEGGETESQPAQLADAQETITSPSAPAGGMDYGMDVGAPMMAPTVSSGSSDPTAAVFTGLLFACVLLLGMAGFATTAALQDVTPSFLSMIGSGANLYMYTLGGGVVVAGIAALVGFLVGRSGAPATRRVAR